MNDDYSVFLSAYSNYLSGRVSHERTMGLAVDQVKRVWKSDEPLLQLERQFDTAAFPNPETERAYRLLNLEVARMANSYTTIARAAFSCYHVSVTKLNEPATGMTLLVESLGAYLQLGIERSVLICLEHLVPLYEKGSAAQLPNLTENFEKLLVMLELMPSRFASKYYMTSAADQMLNCLFHLQQKQINSPLALKTVARFTTAIVPFLPEPEKKRFSQRLQQIPH